MRTSASLSNINFTCQTDKSMHVYENNGEKHNARINASLRKLGPIHMFDLGKVNTSKRLLVFSSNANFIYMRNVFLN